MRVIVVSICEGNKKTRVLKTQAYDFLADYFLMVDSMEPEALTDFSCLL